MKNKSMKVLIISDTHGHNRELEKVLDKVKPIDALIHCGDIEGQEDYITALADCETFIVAGNNDYFSALPKELEFVLGEKKILLTHGHYYGVSMGNEKMLEEGRSNGVDIVMFGHTHRPCLEQYDDITLLNPGSLSYPRQQGRRPSFMIMEIDKKGFLHYTTKFL